MYRTDGQCAVAMCWSSFVHVAGVISQTPMTIIPDTFLKKYQRFCSRRYLAMTWVFTLNQSMRLVLSNQVYTKRTTAPSSMLTKNRERHHYFV